MDKLINKIYVASNLEIDIKGLEQSFPGIQFSYQYDAFTDALICFSIPDEVDLANIKWIHCLGAGVDKILEANDLIPRNTLITRTVESLPEKMVQYVMLAVLSDLYNLHIIKQNQLNHQWKRLSPRDNHGSVLIFGTGAIGQKLAQALTSHGYHVLGVSKSGIKKDGFNQVYQNYHDIDVEDIDIIINALPLTKDTTGFFDNKLFSTFKNYLYINIGRGKTHDEKALYEQLQMGNIRLAYVDVFATEPLPENHFLWDTPNLIITPHIAAMTDNYDLTKSVAETLKKINNDLPLTNKVDRRKGY